MKLSIKTAPLEGYGAGWLAKCPEMGIIAVAEKEHDAIMKLTQVMARQIQFAEETNRLEGIFTKDL